MAGAGELRATADDPRRRRAAELIGGCSIEISPREALTEKGLRDLLDQGLLAPGTTVFVNHPASVTHHDIVAACALLRRAGFTPVPHVAARRLASFTQARDFLGRAAAEAGVTSALIIGGDPDRRMGPFRDSLDLLTTGVVENSGIGEIILAGYPEGHPRIGAGTLAQALRAKMALVCERGLEVSLVSQFAFEAAPIRRWIASLRAQAILCPVRIGVAGPASIATLAKFAVRCGIGASLRALGRGHAAFARILVEAGPDGLIDALVAEEDPAAPIEGLHVFTFGGLRRTAEWIRARTGNRTI
jgi:methylenetetrahydrofolate reductase (NADPH)